MKRAWEAEAKTRTVELMVSLFHDSGWSYTTSGCWYHYPWNWHLQILVASKWLPKRNMIGSDSFKKHTPTDHLFLLSRNRNEQPWQEFSKTLHHGTWPSVKTDHLPHSYFPEKCCPNILISLYLLHLLFLVQGDLNRMVKMRENKWNRLNLIPLPSSLRTSLPSESTFWAKLQVQLWRCCLCSIHWW